MWSIDLFFALLYSPSWDGRSSSGAAVKDASPIFMHTKENFSIYNDFYISPTITF